VTRAALTQRSQIGEVSRHSVVVDSEQRDSHHILVL
jgi:hypothetical protein